MSKLKKSYVGKVGYCDNKDLGINKPGGHYVYIRDITGDKCDVNVVTSLENKNGLYNPSKLKQVRKGNVYAIPIYDADFKLWSGVGRNSIKNINLSSINNIGVKKIRHRHRFFIGKYMK